MTPTFLQRYRAGDHVRVWNELVALGKGVHDKKYHADALAVAAEMRSLRAAFRRR